MLFSRVQLLTITAFLFLSLNPVFISTSLQSPEKEQAAIVSAEQFLDTPQIPKRVSSPQEEPEYSFVNGETSAVIEIPKIGLKYPIKEGVSLDVIKDSVGHYPSTSGPGQLGNFAVAGHSCCGEHSSPFLRQSELDTGDEIIVETKTTKFKYVVAVVDTCGNVSYTTVKYTDASVINSVPCQESNVSTRRFLTLTTCTPIQSAFTPWRLVTWAELISKENK